MHDHTQIHLFFLKSTALSHPKLLSSLKHNEKVGRMTPGAKTANVIKECWKQGRGVEWRGLKLGYPVKTGPFIPKCILRFKYVKNYIKPSLIVCPKETINIQRQS